MTEPSAVARRRDPRRRAALSVRRCRSVPHVAALPVGRARQPGHGSSRSVGVVEHAVEPAPFPELAVPAAVARLRPATGSQLAPLLLTVALPTAWILATAFAPLGVARGPVLLVGWLGLAVLLDGRARTAAVSGPDVPSPERGPPPSARCPQPGA